jgi:hypothetical protein
MASKMPRRRAAIMSAAVAVFGLLAAGCSSAAGNAASPGQVTTTEVTQTGPKQQHWLSVPDSRIVANPDGLDSPGPELQQTGGDSVPLGAGYFAQDEASRLSNLVSLAHSSTRTPTRPGSQWLDSAVSVANTWTPESADFTARYGSGGTVSGSDGFADASSLYRTVDTSGTTGGYNWLLGDYRGIASYDATDNTLVIGHGTTLASSGFVYAISFAKGTKPSFYASSSAPVDGRPAAASLPAASGAWLIGLPAGTRTTIGIGFALMPSSATATDAARAVAQASSEAATARVNPEGSRAKWTAYWNAYLAKVPVPKDFSISDVSADGVTPAEVESAYYRGFIDLEMNVLPPAPEVGNNYDQLAVGKASLWAAGAPGAKAEAQWDSLLGMQDLVYTDPRAAWSAYQGLLNLAIHNPGRDNGRILGESLPSRKAQTAWILYSATGDRAKLASTYGNLARNLVWESRNLRWILIPGHNIRDERDAEFVVSLIFDLQFAEKIAATLGNSAGVNQWKTLTAKLTTEYENWFFPVGHGAVQKVYQGKLRTSAPADGDVPPDFHNARTGMWTSIGVTQYVATGLAIPGLSSTLVGMLMRRFNGEFAPSQQLAGLGLQLLKAPDAQLMEYGLLDTGSTADANGLINAIVRDIVRSGWFSEVYQASSDSKGDAPLGLGVRPSLFGIANLIDNVWMNNGYRLGEGQASVLRLPGAKGGVRGLTSMGESLNVSLNSSAGTATVSGGAVRSSMCTFPVAVGQTVAVAAKCHGR